MTINSLSLQTGGIYPPEIGQAPIQSKCFTPEEAKEYVLKHEIPVFRGHLEDLKFIWNFRHRKLAFRIPDDLAEIVSNYLNGNNHIDEALIKYCLSYHDPKWGLLKKFLEEDGCIIGEETVVPMIISNNPPEYILKELLKRNISPHILRGLPQVISLSFGVDTLNILIEQKVIVFNDNNPHAWTDLKNEECALYVLVKYPFLDRNHVNLAVEKQWPNVLQHLLESNVTIPNDALFLAYSRKFFVFGNKSIANNNVNILFKYRSPIGEDLLNHIINLSIEIRNPSLIENALVNGIKPDASTLRHCVDLNFHVGANIILSRNPQLNPSFIELEPLIFKKNDSIESWVVVFFQNGIPISNEMIYVLARFCKCVDLLDQALRASPHCDRSRVVMNLCINQSFNSSFIDVLDRLIYDGGTFEHLTDVAANSGRFLEYFDYSALIYCIRNGWLPPENIACNVILIYFSVADEREHKVMARELTSRLFGKDGVNSELVHYTKEICSQIKNIQINFSKEDIVGDSYKGFVRFIDFFKSTLKEQILDTYNNHKRWDVSLQDYWLRVWVNGLYLDCRRDRSYHYARYFAQLDRSLMYDGSSYGLNVELFNELRPMMEAASKREKNYNSRLHAYKLAVLFTSKEEVESYLENYRLKHLRSVQPVHDACLFELPSQGIWSISTWRMRLKRENYKKKWMNLLPLASTIENYLYKELTPYPTVQSRGLSRDKIQKKYYRQISLLEKKSKKSVYELFSVVYKEFKKMKIKQKKDLQDSMIESVRVDSDKYERAEFIHFIIKNLDIGRLTYNLFIAFHVGTDYGDVPEEYLPFASDCIRCGVTRREFDEVITTIKQRSSQRNLVPDVLVRGEDLGFPEFRLEKMKDTDPMIALAGYKTGCCQNINGTGKSAAFHALKSPYGGIYRIMKKNIWVAQAWTALTKNNELLFDSIERNYICDKERVLAFFEAAAHAVLRDNPMIVRVLCGSGGNTPKEHSYPFQSLVDRSNIRGYGSYGYDSRSRFILADRQRLSESSTSSSSASSSATIQ